MKQNKDEKIQDMRGSLWAANYIQIINNKAHYCGYQISRLKISGPPTSKHLYKIIGGGAENEIIMGEIALSQDDFDKIDDLLDPSKCLWNILDEIDTLGDIVKPNDLRKYKIYFNRVNELAAKRFNYLKSDGYKLFTPQQWEKR